MSKKVTYLPGLERPKDLEYIKKIVLPKEGGIKTYYRGLKYPYPGYICRESAKTIEFVKRSFILIFKYIISMKKSDLFRLIFLKRIIQRFIPKWLSFSVWVIRDVKLKPHLYSHSVREIHRLFNLIIQRETNLDMKDKWKDIRDILCMVLEVDKSYRFRVQDILSELDVEKMKLDESDKQFASFERVAYNFNLKKND